MSRTLTGLAAALFVSVLVPACGRRVCPLGPLFVDSRTVIAAAGTHDFVVTLHEEEHNSCAPWARYDFTLEVQ